jgi:hypothetical protein
VTGLAGTLHLCHGPTSRRSCQSASSSEQRAPPDRKAKDAFSKPGQLAYATPSTSTNSRPRAVGRPIHCTPSVSDLSNSGPHLHSPTATGTHDEAGERHTDAASHHFSVGSHGHNYSACRQVQVKSRWLEIPPSASHLTTATREGSRAHAGVPQGVSTAFPFRTRFGASAAATNSLHRRLPRT